MTDQLSPTQIASARAMPVSGTTIDAEDGEDAVFALVFALHMQKAGIFKVTKKSDTSVFVEWTEKGLAVCGIQRERGTLQ